MNIERAVKKAYKIGMAQKAAEITMLTKFLCLMKPTNVMEIGTDKGGVFFLLCKASRGIKISLDLPCAKGGSKFDVAQRNEMMRTWGSNIHILEGDSHDKKHVQDVQRILNEQELDFLFIDGDHSYEGVKQDFEMYSPLVKSGGFIAFHDVNDTAFHRNHNCYVSKFWNELEGVKFEFNVFSKRWAGIGVYRKP